MHAQSKPTAADLLISWQLIWTRLLNGKTSELEQAIASHIKLFPNRNQADARTRAERTLAQHKKELAQVRAIIERTRKTLRSA